MATELKKTQQSTIAVIESKSIGTIIKPLIKEIHLFDTMVAGTTHLEDKSVLDEIAEGKVLKLQREDNEYDEKAILILLEDGRKLGYVPECDNIVFSRLMDAGKLLTAKITSIEHRGNFTKINIGIYMVDF